MVAEVAWGCYEIAWRTPWWMVSTTTTNAVLRSVESEERKEGKQKPFKVFGACLSVSTELKCCHPLFLCSSCICLHMYCVLPLISAHCWLIPISLNDFLFVYGFYLGHGSTSFIHLLIFGWLPWARVFKVKLKISRERVCLVICQYLRHHWFKFKELWLNNAVIWHF